MDKNNLKKYIKCVYNLEKSLYSQQSLINRLKYEMQHPSTYKQIAHENKNYIPKTLDVDAATVVAVIFFGGAFGALIGAIIYTLLSKFIGFYFSGTTATIVTICSGIAVPFIYLFNEIRSGIKNRNASIEKNRAIEKRNRMIDVKNERNRQLTQKQINIISQEVQTAYRLYEKTREVLDIYYRCGVIYPKYRNFVAVSSFYEYFESGRCSQLEGHEGAYNIFEVEIRQNMIISKLDDVIKRLDDIRDNQYMLYEAINNSNREIDKLTSAVNRASTNLQNLSNTAEVIAYHSQISSQNTEYLKWVTFFNN